MSRRNSECFIGSFKPLIFQHPIIIGNREEYKQQHKDYLDVPPGEEPDFLCFFEE
jgi:hypothetical protein